MDNDMKILIFSVREVQYLKQLAHQFSKQGKIIYERKELDTICRLIDLLFSNGDNVNRLVFSAEELENLKNIYNRMVGSIRKYHKRMNKKYDKFNNSRIKEIAIHRFVDELFGV